MGLRDHPVMGQGKVGLKPSSALAPEAFSCNPRPSPAQYLCVNLLIDGTLCFLLFLHSQEVYQGPNSHTLQGRRLSDILVLPPWQGS